MAMRKIKKGDQVIVLAGKDKGKQGNILSVINDAKVVVENVNLPSWYLPLFFVIKENKNLLSSPSVKSNIN